MSKYTIGLDYGTLSGRALLVRVSDGAEIGYKEFAYPHAVMDTALPCGKALGFAYALQDPNDYIDVLKQAVPALLQEYAVDPGDVIGIGIDFTSCTVMPTLADGTPLCNLPKFADEPHAYTKLWKHHAAQYCADRINTLACERNESWIHRYGDKVSSEFLLPKLLQIYTEAPQVLAGATYFMEAGDWLAWTMVGGDLKRSACMAGYKSLRTTTEMLPKEDFLEALAPGFGKEAMRLLKGDVLPVGSTVGTLNQTSADWMGLKPGIPVATPVIDAHAAYPASGLSQDGELLMIMGTSTCHISVSNTYKEAPGICGIVEDGVIPGYYGYESGQACVGDHFAWLSENAIPASYAIKAKENHLSLPTYLSSLAQKLKPGESGLLALDWWNGNRTPLTDGDLTGLLLGMTLTTKPEEIYRALLEATAFGTRAIIDNYRENGIPIHALVACGGMAASPFILQVYADVTGMPIRTTASQNAPALGAAIFGALAAGKAGGGYDCISDATAAMGKLNEATVQPNPSAVAVYDSLYQEYRTLTSYFARGENHVMKRLLSLKRAASQQN